ncbi:hypothetical protein AB3S75_037738 [Citrus x aurantiifolia]
MVLEAGLAGVAKQAEQLRLDGNFYFSKDRYGAAIDAYTEAITLCPNVPIYWTNRALCHLKRNDWTKVEADCRKAIQLDHDSVKGHYLLGLTLLQRNEYAEGIKELEKWYQNKNPETMAAKKVDALEEKLEVEVGSLKATIDERFNTVEQQFSSLETMLLKLTELHLNPPPVASKGYGGLAGEGSGGTETEVGDGAGVGVTGKGELGAFGGETQPE